MEETRMRMTENGRVVIPASIRKTLGIRPGDEIVLRVEDDELRIATVRNRIRQAQKLVRRYLKPGDRSMSDELIAERREAAMHE